MLAALRAAPERDDPLAELAAHTEIGNAARVLHRLDLAERHLLLAMQLAARHGSPAQAVHARVRYAHVLQWQGRYELARAEFARCQAATDAASAHFVHQHAGKCLYDAGNWAAAVAHFEAALRLREATGNAELVESSRQALDAAGAARTAAAVAVELHRLVPAVHAAARRTPRPTWRRCSRTPAA